MDRKKTIFIFGISSFVGSSLAEELQDEYRIIGTYYETPVSLPGVLTLKCDINNKDLVEKLIYIFSPDFTIYTVGLSDLYACQEFPKVADALNTVGVFNAAAASERSGSKFIYFSSCYIFSGEDVFYREQDTPMPVCAYGNTIASSEFFIQKSCLNYIIFRCSPIIGRSYNPNDLTFPEALDHCAFKGKSLMCDGNVNTGFIDTITLSEILKWALKENVTNRLFQVSSSDLMTRYDFAKVYFEVFEGDANFISKGSWNFPKSDTVVAKQLAGDELYFRMDVSNLELDMGIMLPSVKKAIEKLYKKYAPVKQKASKRSSTTEIKYI